MCGVYFSYPLFPAANEAAHGAARRNHALLVLRGTCVFAAFLFVFCSRINIKRQNQYLYYNHVSFTYLYSKYLMSPSKLNALVSEYFIITTQFSSNIYGIELNCFFFFLFCIDDLASNVSRRKCDFKIY